MTAPVATPTDGGPFPGREGEPVPEAALLAQHALALYWAALDAGDAIEELEFALEEDDFSDEILKEGRARLREAELRLWKATNAVRVPTLASRMQADLMRAQVTP